MEGNHNDDLKKENPEKIKIEEERGLVGKNNGVPTKKCNGKGKSASRVKPHPERSPKRGKQRKAEDSRRETERSKSKIAVSQITASKSTLRVEDATRQQVPQPAVKPKRLPRKLSTSEHQAMTTLPFKMPAHSESIGGAKKKLGRSIEERVTTLLEKNPIVSSDEIISALLEKKDEIVLKNDNENMAIANSKSDVWNRVSACLNFRLSSKMLYAFVVSNSSNIWETLGLTTSSAEKEECDNASPGNSIPQKTEFTIYLSCDEWNKLITNKIYQKTENTQKHPSKRVYYCIHPYQWDKLLNEKIWSESGIPCSWIYKRARLYQTNKYNYLYALAACKHCNTKLLITLQKGSTSHGGNIELSCSIRKEQTEKNTRPCSHRGVIIPIKQDTVIDIHPTTNGRRPNSVSVVTHCGEPGSVNLQTTSLLQTAKSQAIAKKRLHSDVMEAILLMKYSWPYEGSIHSLGIDPFTVHYWASDQLRIYRECCSEQLSYLSIDANETLVKKLRRPNSKLSQSIFLYICLITTPHLQIPVCQMLSEKQDANVIQYWLAEWTHFASMTPKEVVTSYSLDILEGVARCFSGRRNLQEYLEACWECLHDSDRQNLPECFIRIGSEHVIRIMSKWKSLYEVHETARQFYLKGIEKLLSCIDINTCLSILKSILIVAYSQTNGATAAGEQSICQKSQEYLQSLFDKGDGPSIVGRFLTEVTDIGVVSEDAPEVMYTSISAWIKVVSTECKLLAEQNGGVQVNTCYAPNVAFQIEKICSTVTLWTALMQPIFNSENVIATNNAVECEFGNIRSSFKQRQLPLRADEFLLHHLITIDKQVKDKLAVILGNKGIEEKTPFEILAAESSQKHFLSAATVPPVLATLDIKGNRYPNPTHIHGNITTEHFVRPTETEQYVQNCGCGKALSSENCVTHASGNISTGMHSCINFKKSAYPMKAAGGEQGRLAEGTCLSCSKHRTNNETLRGSSISKYLKKQDFNHSKSLCLLPRRKLTKPWKLPVMKNGNKMSDKPIKVQNELLILSNTCAFDSITQGLLCAYCDSDSYRLYVKQYQETNLFFHLLHKLSSKKISRSCYALRARILRDNSQTSQYHLGVRKINCEATVEAVAKHIFSDVPSYTHIRKCSSVHCTKKEQRISVVVVPIEDTAFLDEEIKCFQRSLRHCVDVPPTPCRCESDDTSNVSLQSWSLYKSNSWGCLCSGTVSTISLEEGPHIFVEIIQKGNEKKFPLSHFPKQVTVCETSYQLRSIIEFLPPLSSGVRTIGHFVSHCLRSDDTWVKFDDLDEKPVKEEATQIVLPHLLIYTI